MKKILIALTLGLLATSVSATDVTWSDKTTGGSFTAADANAVKAAVNSKADQTEVDLNTDKTGITSGQAAAIVANTDKETNTDDQTASEVVFAPGGTVAATTVQAAILEVASEASATGEANETMDATPTDGNTDHTVGSGGLFDEFATKQDIADVIEAKVGTGLNGAIDSGDGKFEISVKDGGIDTTQLADGAVTSAKLADGVGGTGGYVTPAPTYSDEACTPGQYAFADATTGRLCISSGDWDSFVIADWTNLTPTTYSLTMAITDATGTGSTFTVDEVAANVGDTPKTWAGLSSATEAITFTADDDETSSCTGTGVTGSDPNWVVDMSGAHVTDAVCTVSSALASIFSDDFSSDTITSGDWVEDSGDYSISSGELASPSGQALLRYATETSTLAQYFGFTYIDVPSGSLNGIQFRIPGTTGSRYNLYYNQSTTLLQWQTFSGPTTWQNNIKSSSTFVLSPGDKIRATIQGTGADTVVNVWINPTNNTPHSIDNWDSASDPADHVFANDPTYACDTGKYLGIVTSVISQIDDVYGGSL